LTALLMAVPVAGGESDVVVAEADPRDVRGSARLAAAAGRVTGAARSCTDAFRCVGPAVQAMPGALAGNIGVGGGGD